jgi:hypothetical protein
VELPPLTDRFFAGGKQVNKWTIADIPVFFAITHSYALSAMFTAPVMHGICIGVITSIDTKKAGDFPAFSL